MIGALWNPVAVLAGALSSMIVGSLWYSPMFFGKQWLSLMGFSKKDMSAMKQKSMGATYLMAFIGSVVMSLVLWQFMNVVGVVTVREAIATAFWIWVGFIAPLLLGSVLWENKPVGLFMLNGTHWLVTLVVMSLVLLWWL